MKRLHVIITALLSAASFYAGYLMSDPSESGPAWGTPSSSAVAERTEFSKNVASPTSVSRDQRIIQLEEALEREQAHNRMLQNELTAAAPKLERYQWFHERMAKGSNTSYIQINATTLTPTKDLISFFKLDENQVKQFDEIAEQAISSMKDWEAAQAKMLYSTDDKIVYEIPAPPASIMEKYYAGVTNLLGEDDFQLVVASAQRNIPNKWTSKRKIWLELGPGNEGKLSVQAFDEDGRGVGGISTTGASNIDHLRLDKRWGHLFTIEDSDSGEE